MKYEYKKITGYEQKKFIENGHTMFEEDVLQRLKRLAYLEEQRKQANGAEKSDSNCNIPLVTASYFDKIQKGFKKLQEDCTEVRLVGFCQKDDIPDEAHREEFEEEFDHEYQLTQSDGFDEASFWGDIYLQLDDTLYMRFDVIG